MRRFSIKTQVVILLLSAEIAEGQEMRIDSSGNSFRNKFSIETSLHAGKILRHTNRLTINTSQLIVGSEINLRLTTHGSREWHQLHRFPIYGLSFCHFRFGADAHDAGFGFVPNLTVPFFRKEKWLFGFRLGTGIGYVTRPYDYFSNPGENAIGSFWNNITQFRLGGEASLGGHFRAGAGLSFTHFSNGGTEFPNFGMNIPTGYFSIAYSPEKERFIKKNKLRKKPEKRFGGQLHAGVTYIEYLVWDGPLYPIWSGSGAGVFYFSKINRALIGLDYEFNRAIHDWGLHTTGFKTEAEARRGATRLAATLADEFLFGNLGIQLLLGVYVGKGINAQVPLPFYEKLSIRYYCPALFRTAVRPHFGVCLKAHKMVAEYISLNAGIDF